MCRQYADNASPSIFRRAGCGRRLCTASKCQQGSGAIPRQAVDKIIETHYLYGTLATTIITSKQKYLQVLPSSHLTLAGYHICHSHYHRIHQLVDHHLTYSPPPFQNQLFQSVADPIVSKNGSLEKWYMMVLKIGNSSKYSGLFGGRVVQFAEAHRDDGGGSDGGRRYGLMELGGTVRWLLSANSHVPLLASLLFCQPLATVTRSWHAKTPHMRGVSGAPTSVCSSRLFVSGHAIIHNYYTT